MNIDMKTIGIRIKERRTELGLKQNEIKATVGISSGNLSEIENGNRAPSMLTLYRLSQILDCSIDWIVTGKSPCKGNGLFSLQGDAAKMLNYFNSVSRSDQEELLMIAELKFNKTQNAASNLSPSVQDNENLLE